MRRLPCSTSAGASVAALGVVALILRSWLN